MAGTTGRGPMPRTAGFTLIELAVALSVIGILIAVGFKSLTAWLDSENRKITEQGSTRSRTR